MRDYTYYAHSSRASGKAGTPFLLPRLVLRGHSLPMQINLQKLAFSMYFFYIFIYFNYPGTAQASQGIPGLLLTSRRAFEYNPYIIISRDE